MSDRKHVIVVTAFVTIVIGLVVFIMISLIADRQSCRDRGGVPVDGNCLKVERIQ